MARDADRISLAALLVEVRRRAPRDPSGVSESELRDPLDALIARIRSAPYAMEHRVLAQVLIHMGEDSSQIMIRLPEIDAFGSAVLLLLSAFTNDYMSGRYDQAALQAALVDLEVSTFSGPNSTSG